VARVIGIGVVVKHCVQAEIVEIRERKAWASVKEMVGRKVVEEDAAVSIIGVEEILEAQVNVVGKILVREVAIVAKGRAVGELEIVPAAAQRGLASEDASGDTLGSASHRNRRAGPD